MNLESFRKKRFLHHKKTATKSANVDKQLYEHTPEMYQYAPGSEDALKFRNLQIKKRDLYNKAVSLKREDQLTSLIVENQTKGISARTTIKDILSNQAAVGRTFTNIEARTQTIENILNSGLHDLRDSLRTKWSGLTQDRELGYEVVRYLKDGRVKNQALEAEVKKLALQWNKATNTIKKMRNKAGARIRDLEDWVMPQAHDDYKIRTAGKTQWINDIKPKLDTARIESEQGGLIDDILDNAYDNITKRQIDTMPTGATSVVAKKHEYERVLHFKTGDDIIEYNKVYGNEDVFSIMDTHIRAQSNEIAQMQVMGANPEAMYNKLKVLARNEGMGTQMENSLDRLWNVATGKADRSDSISALDFKLEGISGGFRAASIASKLGTATISSIADISTILVGSGYRGLNSVNIMGKGLQTLIQEAITVGKVGKNMTLVSRLALVSEFANASMTNTRFAEMGSGWFQRRAENVIRGSGLSAWTNSLRTSFSLELAGKLADNFGTAFDDIPFKKMLEEYGITADDWVKISQSKLYKEDGARLLDINEVFAVDEELGFKVSQLVSNEINAFITTPGYRTRAITTWGSAKGTVAGEASRNMMLFKSFPVTIMMTHFNRMGQLSGGGKLAYGSSVLVSGVVMGTVSLWMTDLATGKTPRDPNRAAMIPEAIAKSGGLGFFGDIFMGQDVTRYGHSWVSTFVGVPATALEDIGKTLVADPLKVASGNMDMADYVGNTYNRAKQYIPGQNLWYTRAAVENSIGQFVGEIVDPKYRKKRRKQEKALRTRGQEFIFNK